MAEADRAILAGQEDIRLAGRAPCRTDPAVVVMGHTGRRCLAEAVEEGAGRAEGEETRDPTGVGGFVIVEEVVRSLGEVS